MFKNRAIEMKVVKTPKGASQSDKTSQYTPVVVQQIALETVERVAFLVGTGYALKKVLDTASDVAIIAAKAKIK